MNASGLKEMKLAKQPVSIKIEDDSDDECNTVRKKPKHAAEKTTQTSAFNLVGILKKLVEDRLKIYEEKIISEEFANMKIDSTIAHLQKENIELKKRVALLKEKLARFERRATKRPSEGSSVAPANKMVSTPPNSGVTSTEAERTKSPEPENGNSVSLNDPASSQQNGAFHYRYRTPVQMVAPVQQITNGMLPRQSFYAGNEPRLIIVDQGGSMYGTNLSGSTQVVPANNSLRMTLTPQQHFPRFPLNAQSNIIGQNSFNQYQQLINIQRYQIPRNVALPPPQQLKSQQILQQNLQQSIPAQLQTSTTPKQVQILPKLKASISASGNGIILTWDYDQSLQNSDNFRKVECYHLFAHQARDNRVTPPSDIKQWKKIGVVNAMPLPMACTLTQFATGNIYFFSVLAVDIHGREGEMSNPCIIRLNLDS